MFCIPAAPRHPLIGSLEAITLPIMLFLWYLSASQPRPPIHLFAASPYHNPS
jgi:hypothetical protein